MAEFARDWQAALDYLQNAVPFVCADCPDSEELVQESMIAYLEAGRRGESIAYPKAWLERVLRSKYNAWLRKKSKVVGIGIQGSTGMGNEPLSLIRSKIELNMLYLAYDKPVSLKDIADTMSIPHGQAEDYADAVHSPAGAGLPS